MATERNGRENSGRERRAESGPGKHPPGPAAARAPPAPRPGCEVLPLGRHSQPKGRRRLQLFTTPPSQPSRSAALRISAAGIHRRRCSD
ncbi:jg27655 [Pararge aegeria aegeria]|uniref:Jg27655 protein n=1 Tax=Pararge aegeria aegeria TaxID=348720 RepID=A0A8S4RPH1_9NEOP|nr:jg27655 [Pararge aegeria aegeria]